jgi:hypothetical protein
MVTTMVSPPFIVKDSLASIVGVLSAILHEFLWGKAHHDYSRLG